MPRTLRALLLVFFANAMLRAADIPVQPATPGSPNLTPDMKATVCVDPGSFVRRDILARGMVTTDAIFKRVGVKLKWSCDAGITGRKPANAHAVLVRVVDDVEGHVSDTAIAYARPYASGGTRVVILWRRFHPFVESRPDSAGIIFGHVMAHELAHVFSRSDYHGFRGLMSPNWTEKDFDAMETGLLFFSSEEARFIRDGLHSIEEPNGEKIAAHPASEPAHGPLINSFR